VLLDARVGYRQTDDERVSMVYGKLNKAGKELLDFVSLMWLQYD